MYQVQSFSNGLWLLYHRFTIQIPQRYTLLLTSVYQEEGAVLCPDRYDCLAMGQAPYGGLVTFDNVGLALMTVMQVMTLEGWSDIMDTTQVQKCCKTAFSFLFPDFPSFYHTTVRGVLGSGARLFDFAIYNLISQFAPSYARCAVNLNCHGTDLLERLYQGATNAYTGLFFLLLVLSGPIFALKMFLAVIAHRLKETQVRWYPRCA